jgi:hypothetical protein
MVQKLAEMAKVFLPPLLLFQDFKIGDSLDG